MQDGCLLVPFGNPYSQESHLQWRISFSLAETKLVHSFNHNQYLCYGLLKLFLKHAINSNTQVKDSLCSYFLKTSLFYCIEKENIVWNQENLLDCFSSCLGRLITWIWDENSLNYFIKNNNKIEGKICKSNSKVLYDYLLGLYNDRFYSLSLIPCLSKDQIVHDRMFSKATNSLIVRNEFREYLCDSELLKSAHRLFIFYDRDFKKYHDTIIKIMHQTSDPIDRAIMTLWSSILVNYFVPSVYKDIQTTTTNKRRYRQIKGLKQFIINNCLFSDICTGMLLLAT